MFTKILGQSLEKPLNSKIKSVMKGHRTIFLNLKKKTHMIPMGIEINVTQFDYMKV